MGRRTFLGIDEGVAGMFARGDGDVFHIESNKSTIDFKLDVESE